MGSELSTTHLPLKISQELRPEITSVSSFLEFLRVLSIAVTEESVQLSRKSETRHVLDDLIEEKGEM